MEQRHELGHYILDRIGDEHLVAVELDLVLGDLQLVLDLREIEDSGEVERIIHIQVDIEQRIVERRIEAVVELHIILVLQIGRLLGPEGLQGIDDIVLLGIDILAVLPLLLLAQGHGNRHKLAVPVEELAYAALFGVFLGFIIEIESDDGAAVRLFARLHLILGIAVARPFDSLRSLFV